MTPSADTTDRYRRKAEGLAPGAAVPDASDLVEDSRRQQIWWVLGLLVAGLAIFAFQGVWVEGARPLGLQAPALIGGALEGLALALFVAGGWPEIRARAAREAGQPVRYFRYKRIELIAPTVCLAFAAVLLTVGEQRSANHLLFLALPLLANAWPRRNDIAGFAADAILARPG